jgi:hypothetical protein
MRTSLVKQQDSTSPANRGFVQRKCHCAGTCDSCRGPGIAGQRKIAVGDSRDPLEREADRAADHVLAGRFRSDLSRIPISAQGHAAGAAMRSQDMPVSVERALDMSGTPLDPPLRQDMETRFGHDFSHVRLHRDGAAERSARDMAARAYTVGSHIVFAAGEFSPDTSSGRHVLAHELAHVVQQTGGAADLTGVPQLQRLEAASPGAENVPAPSTICGGGVAVPCTEPDSGREGSGKPATAWSLKVKVDIEAPTGDFVISNVGHAFVEFLDSSGAAYTYGFYPNKALETPIPGFNPTVPGCVAHPDTSHAAAVDYTETFSVTVKEFAAALEFAQGYCQSPPDYNVQVNNCTTFARNVAAKANQSLPPIMGLVGVMPIPADNPNTLFDGLMKRAVGPTYMKMSDTEIREAISEAKPAEIRAMPSGERVRIVKRLLGGWVADEDLEAIEKICAAVDDAQLVQLREAIAPLEKTLVFEGDRERLHAALFGLGPR